MPWPSGHFDFFCAIVLTLRMTLDRLAPPRLFPQVVAVVPVIGKSDSMTLDEMKSFKKDIVDLASQGDRLEFFQFSGA